MSRRDQITLTEEEQLELLERMAGPGAGGGREDVGQPGRVPVQNQQVLEVEVRALRHQPPEPLVQEVVLREDQRVQARRGLPDRIRGEAHLRQVRDVDVDLDHGHITATFWS